MIDNTPLLAIRFSFKGKERVIYAKAEHLNMTGSIKDRMAFHILKKAYQEGHILPGTLSRRQPAEIPAFRSPRSHARWDIKLSSSCTPLEPLRRAGDNAHGIPRDEQLFIRGNYVNGD